MLALLIPLLPAEGAVAAQAEVSVEDDVFVPADVTVDVGGSVHWSRGPGSIGPHNVREDDGLFRSGPVTEGPIDHTEVFSSGTFHYFCDAHGSRAGGMAGFVRVAPTADDGPQGRRFTVTWATTTTTTGSRFDVQYRVGGRRWMGWKGETHSLGGVFGRRGEPVKVLRGRSYTFRVRSLSGDAGSRWSPPVSYRV